MMSKLNWARVRRITQLSAWAFLLVACSHINFPGFNTNNAKQTQTVEALAKLVIAPVNIDSLTVSATLSQVSASEFVWLPDGEVAIASEGSIKFIDLYPSKTLPEPGIVSQAGVTREYSTNSPYLLTTAKSKYMAWATTDPAVHIYGFKEGKEIYKVDPSPGAVTSLAFSPNGLELASATFDGCLRIWDSAKGQVIKDWTLDIWLSNITYSPDGTLLAGVDLANFTVYIYNVSTGELMINLQWAGSAHPALYGVYFSPDWQQIAWVARGTVQLMSVPKGELGYLLSHEDFVSALAWSPNGNVLATAAAGIVNNEFVPAVFLWEVSSGKLVKALSLRESVTSLAFSPDGKQLATLTSRGVLSTWIVVP